jgi:hypothetical protein
MERWKLEKWVYNKVGYQNASDDRIPHTTVIIQKLTVAQRVMRHPSFYINRRFITVFTTALH